MFLKLHLELMADVSDTILFSFFFIKQLMIVLRPSHEGRRRFRALPELWPLIREQSCFGGFPRRSRRL